MKASSRSGKHDILLEFSGDAAQKVVLDYIKAGTLGQFPLVEVKYDNPELEGVTVTYYIDKETFLPQKCWGSQVSTQESIATRLNARGSRTVRSRPHVCIAAHRTRLGLDN